MVETADTDCERLRRLGSRTSVGLSINANTPAHSPVLPPHALDVVHFGSIHIGGISVPVLLPRVGFGYQRVRFSVILPKFASAAIKESDKAVSETIMNEGSIVVAGTPMN